MFPSGMQFLASVMHVDMDLSSMSGAYDSKLLLPVERLRRETGCLYVKSSGTTDK